MALTKVTEKVLSNNIKVSGIVTATSFYGDGSNLTGIDATALKHSDGNVKVQANNFGAVVTGVMTATSFKGDGSALTGLQLSKELTIGVRVGAAVTFTVTGSSFNVLNRSGGNVPISI